VARDLVSRENSVNTFSVIPSIDIRGGKCVRLFQGDYAQETVFDADPVAVARRWEAEGASLIHVVDLDGARDGEPANLRIIAAICKAVQVPVEMGGGLRDAATIRRVLDAGVERAIVGTVATDPKRARELIDAFAERLAIGIDARGGMVAVRGWKETTEVEAVRLAQTLEALGARRVIHTDIARDCTLEGPNITGMRAMAEALQIPVIASGGVGSAEDVHRLAALAPLGVEGVIIGRALYTGAVSLAALAVVGT
jgi:phosphoribosylformimino-5-aminoimidazole carboxamide ribotide isomerase